MRLQSPPRNSNGPLRPRSRAFAHRLAASLLACLALLSAGCATFGPSAEERARNLRVAQARRNVGIDYLAGGRTPMAIRELRRAQTLDPNDPVTIHWLGEAYRRRGMLELALENFLKALEIDPEAQEARVNLAGLYIQRKRYPEAIEQAQILIDDPTFSSPWRAYTNRGWAEFKLGHLDAAQASFEEALNFRRTYWPARLNLGILEAKRGRDLPAIANFEQVLERDIGKTAASEVNYHLGQSYVGLGRRAEAMEHFKVSAAAAPYSRWAEQSAASLKLLH